MLPRVLEPEIMDAPDDADDYDRMDHSAVNRAFVQDFLTIFSDRSGTVVDVGTGSAQIPIELCGSTSLLTIDAVDAAAGMIRLARNHVDAAKLSERIRLHLVDARGLPFPNRSAAAVISNSIVHHIAEPAPIVAEMVRVCEPGGVIFVRDLLRPSCESELDHLVKTYAADANDHQRRLFSDSLRAALTLDEVQSLVADFGFAAETVSRTSDRHWTWSATLVQSQTHNFG